MQKKQYFSVYRLAFIGVMAAVVYTVSLFAFPFLGSKVHFGNTMCLLSGLLFGPLSGGLAAGIGSFLVDLVGGYGLESFITLVSKFAMAAVAGLIGHGLRQTAAGAPVSRPVMAVRAVVGSVVGAWLYVALYMLKHFVLRFAVEQVGLEATVGVMLSKLPGSAINACFAMVCAPLLYLMLRPALVRMPAYRKICA